jgi:hypothetical protein
VESFVSGYIQQTPITFNRYVILQNKVITMLAPPEDLHYYTCVGSCDAPGVKRISILNRAGSFAGTAMSSYSRSTR